MSLQHGIRANLAQFLHQLLQVLLVGMTIGMMRTVVPALAEDEFDLPRGSFLLLVSFVVAFGVVKAALNLAAGSLSDRYGRRQVLLAGWLAAVPVPWMVWHAPDWSWIIAATVLLGVNQGLTWSMTQTAKLDLGHFQQRGLAIGLNECAGYGGVAAAGIATAILATHYGARDALLVFGYTVIGLALALTLAWVRDTRPWARAETTMQREGATARARYPTVIRDHPCTREVFAVVSWRDARLAALCQAGLVEKFVDALVWAVLPAYLYARNVPLPEIGWIVAVYGFTWGASQLITGPLSDRIGRQRPNVWGMWICGAGVALIPLADDVAAWSLCAGIVGLGMALLYPNLLAAVADISRPEWRGTAIGTYRFWRDFGYAVGAAGLGLAAQLVGDVTAAFWFVAISMFGSGALLYWLGEETHPGLNPAPTSPRP